MSDWRRRSEFDLINIQNGRGAVAVISVAILFRSANALSLPRNAKAAKPKYQRIVRDDFVD